MKKTIAILLALLFALQIAVLPAAAEGESASDVPTLSSANAVSSYIRAEMVNRSTEIRYKASNALLALIGATLSNICTHTGNGAEGDYLRLALNYVFPQPVKDADGVYTLHPVYYTTAEQEAAVDAYVENVVAGCTAQDSTEIARYLYDYLCEHVTFDLENLYNDEDMLKYTAYGAAINGKAVCQGFASLYYKLALAAGLDCRIVTGTRGDVAHAWNIIKIDDLWYHVDASSGAQLLDNSAYFMKLSFDGYTINYGNETSTEIQDYSFAESVIKTGSIGDNITYTMNEQTGKLVLSGTGPMTVKFNPIYNPIINFDRSLVKSVVISEGITSIADYLFYRCENMESVSISSTVEEIGARAFSRSLSELTDIHVSADSPFYASNGTCLINKTTKELTLGTQNCVIPNDGSVEKIGVSAFSSNVNLKNITLPNSLKSIEESAFYNCPGLTTVIIPSNVTYIGLRAFYGCSGLTKVIIPSNVTCIDQWAFAHCDGLEEVSFPQDLQEIGDSAFLGCKKLKQIAIPKAVSDIGDTAFSGCNNLESVTVDAENDHYHSENNCLIHTESKTMIAACSNSVIPNDGSVTRLRNVFNNCSTLTHIDLPDCITEIVGFNDCSSLTNISIPNSVKIIDGFYGCTGLKKVVFPNGITNITGFEGCDGLTSVTIPESTVQLGYTEVTETQTTNYSAFQFCDKLKTIRVLSKNVKIANNTFLDAPLLTTIYGFTGSTAEAFAQERNITFVSLCPLTNEPHNVQTADATEPDCLNPGYTAGTVCPDCGEWLSGHEVSADALGHNPGTPVPENVVAATCTAEGSYDNVTRCTRCNIVLSSTAEKIAMTPHADNDRNGYCDDCGAYICEHPETALQNAKAPTCTEAGYSGDTVCGYCGVTLTYGVTVPATGHSPVISAPPRDATCLDPGQTAVYTCSVCNTVTTAAQPTPLAAHTDADSDGLCDICLAPTDCTQYGRCGDDLFWYVDGGVLVISGSGASGTLDTTPWESCSAQIDAAYLKDSVTAMDGALFTACSNLAYVYAAAATTVSRCSVPVLTYTDANGVCTVSGRNNVPTMDLPALLNTASILCIDRTVTALRFDRLSLRAAEDGQEIVYDILKNGKIIDENHFRLPSGTLLNAFSMKPLSYASFNSAFAAIAENPDRNLILSLNCTDLLPAELQADSESYTEQFVLHFVDKPVQPDTPNAPAAEKTLVQKIVERFQATLAAILSIFKKLFRLFKR